MGLILRRRAGECVRIGVANVSIERVSAHGCRLRITGVDGSRTAELRFMQDLPLPEAAPDALVQLYKIRGSVVALRVVAPGLVITRGKSPPLNR